MLFILTSAAFVVFLLCRPFSAGGHRPGWPIGVVVVFLLGATTLLHVWSAVCVKDEPRLVRIVLIWGGLLFLLFTVSIYMVDGKIE
jgi:hypothetical protein